MSKRDLEEYYEQAWRLGLKNMQTQITYVHLVTKNTVLAYINYKKCQESGELPQEEKDILKRIYDDCKSELPKAKVQFKVKVAWIHVGSHTYRVSIEVAQEMINEELAVLM